MDVIKEGVMAGVCIFLSNILRWTQDVWLQWLISSGLLAPVLILNLSPKEIHRLFPWRPFTLLLSDSVCTALCLCAASLTHWDNVCISSYSQANPPPIIVNADSLDAGPYVSICICLPDCLSFSEHCLSIPFTPPQCVRVSVHVCVRVCVRKRCLLLSPVCFLFVPCCSTSIFFFTLPVFGECASFHCARSVSVLILPDIRRHAFLSCCHKSQSRCYFSLAISCNICWIYVLSIYLINRIFGLQFTKDPTNQKQDRKSSPTPLPFPKY